MTFSKTSFFIVISIIIILNGCSMLRLENDDQDNVLEVFYPVQQMSISEKTPDSLVSHLSESEKEDDSMYERENDEQIADLEVPNEAVNLFPSSISGVWNLSVNGKTCRIATPQTKFGQGYRASPLHCKGISSQIKSWAVKGKKLYFYNNLGHSIIVLYSHNAKHFEGHTIDGYTVVLRR